MGIDGKTGDTRLFVAVTGADFEDGRSILQRLEGLPLGIKVGLELFVSRGPGLVERIRDAGFSVFLDLKFHDIPFTVAGAVKSACSLGPELVNVHASGGPDMLRAAAEAAAGSPGGTKVLAVTVLTSLSDRDLALMGVQGGSAGTVGRLARMAMDSGIHGVVCSPREAALVREAAGDDFIIVTPGIRPAGAPMNDQKRVATPKEAVRMGATALVVGRPITASPDPGKAARAILHEITPG